MSISVVAHRGRLSLIELDPRLMRRTPAEVGPMLRDAVEAALTSERDRIPTTPAPRKPDDEAILASYRLTNALRQLGIHVDERELDELDAAISSIEAEVRDSGPGAPVLGTGRYADDSVLVKVDGVCVELVEVTYQALTLPSAELARLVATAVNAALDDAVEPPGHDVRFDDRTERIARLQDECVRLSNAQSAALAAEVAKARRRE